MNVVKIRKVGNFYDVFDDDCYILYFLFGYQIKHYKTGFPKSAFNKVINVLSEKKINYDVVGEDNKECFKNLNGYIKYLKLGKDKYNKDQCYQNIISKLSSASNEKLERILKVIEDILDET